MKVTNFSVKCKLGRAPRSALQPDNKWCLLSNLLDVLGRVELVVDRGVIVIGDGDPPIVDVLVDLKSINLVELGQWIVSCLVRGELVSSEHLHKAG